jgi:LPS export ABC transporter protein LptC
MPIKVTLTPSGADIEIENFKIIHENSGRKEWELKAKLAQINHSQKSTNMTGVKVEYSMQNQQKFWVSADTGHLNTETQDFELTGNVHFTAESAKLAEKIRNKQTPQTP